MLKGKLMTLCLKDEKNTRKKLFFKNVFFYFKLLKAHCVEFSSVKCKTILMSIPVF